MLQNEDARTRSEGTGQSIRFIRHHAGNAKGTVAKLDRIAHPEVETQKQIIANRNRRVRQDLAQRNAFRRYHKLRILELAVEPDLIGDQVDADLTARR